MPLILNLISPFVLALVLFGLILPHTAAAAEPEIHYQSISEVFGETILVVDKSPAGDTYYTCETSGDCRERQDGVSLAPSIYGNTAYPRSGQGRYGAYPQSFPVGGTATTFFTFYDLSGDTPKNVGLLTIAGTIVRQGFSPDERTFVVVTEGGTLTAYDIESGERRSITLPGSDLPFFSISPSGSYVSAYNYVGEVHRIWDTRTGALTELSGTPGYVEFSDSETEAAYSVERGGFKNLAVARGFGGTVTTELVASGPFIVEDYRYVEDELFYLANRRSPLAWSLYQEGDSAPIAEDVSYGVYLARVGDALAYQKIEGKNANLYLFDPVTETHTHLSAAPQSPSAADIAREEITIAGLSAAHLAPRAEGRSTDLIVWLHGGPQRQTSVGYHPYLSYAVYDELLERIASAGNHVLKLDYSGSWGYGEEFLSALQNRVGTVEIEDVQDAVAAFARAHDIDNVYLMGNSYGGYMALRAINEFPETIDGVVSINGVADWQGLIATIPSSPFRELFGSVPDLHNLEQYRSASVFTNFENLDEQPLLVLYGTEDKTVPTSQSLQYDEFMRANDKNVTLVPFHGEEHILRARETLNRMCDTITDGLDLASVACR